MEECYADILLVIDYSGSMKGYWNDVMDFVEALIFGLKTVSPTTVRVGVIFFKETAALEVSHMTVSHGTINNTIVKDTYIHKYTNKLYMYTYMRVHTFRCVFVCSCMRDSVVYWTAYIRMCTRACVRACVRGC